MTPQEAIKVLITVRLPDCNFTDLMIYAEAFSMARESLEKQIPAKVIYGGKLNAPIKIGNTKFGENTHVLRLCPKCNNWVSPSLNKRYCHECGQALDWVDSD